MTTDVIHLLPDSVANQIAAGEVIQRPASVIKELVENAVDAGATTIRVIIVDAGRTSIQVIDDGKGMSPTDARLSFERHATSKILKADDLFALHTMGFRGEALASIAAVAQVELLTRREEDEIGTRLQIAASKVALQEPAACAAGSSFKVENLFYNVPARRKFLKSNTTELANILTAFERIALVYPAIHFTLHHNSAEQFNLRSGSLRQRIADVFGRQAAQDLLPVDVETALCRIHGFVGKPEAARKKSGHDYLFVNGRYMRHPYFHKAVVAAYDRLLPEGLQPPYFLYFEVDAADIDVNIHPVKTEIKFDNEQAIWQILMAAVRDALGRFCEIPSIDFDTEGQPEIPLFDPSSPATSPQLHYTPGYNPFADRKPAAGHSRQPVPQEWEQLYKRAGERPSEADRPAPEPDLFGTDEPIAEKSPDHYQYKGRYLMTAVKSGLMVIDQHRASVRVLYERYAAQLSDRQGSTQRLLFPEVVQFAPAEGPALARLLPDLSALGFELSDLGGGSFAINGVPADIQGIDSVQLLRQIVADASALPSAEQQQAALALTLARQAAIPYGQVLDNNEMEMLTAQLFACSNVNYTPDGKSILAILPQTDIEQLLK